MDDNDLSLESVEGYANIGCCWALTMVAVVTRKIVRSIQNCTSGKGGTGMIAWLYGKFFSYLVDKRLEKACARTTTTIPLIYGTEGVQDHPNLVVLRELIKHWYFQGYGAFIAKGRRSQQVLWLNFAAITTLLFMRLLSAPLELMGGFSGIIIGLVICLIIASMIEDEYTMVSARHKSSPVGFLKREMLTQCNQVGIFQIGLVIAIGFPACNAISTPFLLALPLGILFQTYTLPLLIDCVVEQKLNGDQMRLFISVTGDLLNESRMEEVLNTEMEGGLLTAADFFNFQSRHV